MTIPLNLNCFEFCIIFEDSFIFVVINFPSLRQFISFKKKFGQIVLFKFNLLRLFLNLVSRIKTNDLDLFREGNFTLFTLLYLLKVRFYWGKIDLIEFFIAMLDWTYITNHYLWIRPLNVQLMLLYHLSPPSLD